MPAYSSLAGVELAELASPAAFVRMPDEHIARAVGPLLNFADGLVAILAPNEDLGSDSDSDGGSGYWWWQLWR